MALFERTTNVRIASVTLGPERVRIEKHIGTSLAIKSAFEEGSKSSRKSDLNAIRIGDSQLTSSLLKAESHGYARKYSRRTANRGIGQNQIKTEADNPPGNRSSSVYGAAEVCHPTSAGREELHQVVTGKLTTESSARWFPAFAAATLGGQSLICPSGIAPRKETGSRIRVKSELIILR
jgi:hypothetical protein